MIGSRGEALHRNLSRDHSSGVLPDRAGLAHRPSVCRRPARARARSKVTRQSKRRTVILISQVLLQSVPHFSVCIEKARSERQEPRIYTDATDGHGSSALIRRVRVNPRFLPSEFSALYRSLPSISRPGSHFLARG